MTTIVYRDGLFAADSRLTSNDTIEPGVYDKIFRLKDGSLYGASGDVSFIDAVRASIEKDEAPPGYPLDRMLAIHIDRKGKVWEFTGEGGWFMLCGEYHAWGSGTKFAYGALSMGATAAEAVERAIQFDIYSGGPVLVLQL